MAIHIAANTGCNLGCEYCYEEPDREMKEETISNEYDMDLIMERLEEFRDEYENIMPGMHGGEPLLLPTDDLREIYAWIDENYDHIDDTPHIQTNGTLIQEEHIELFEEYNVSVGISMDGPEELNDSRIARAGNEDVTRKMTSETYDAIRRIIEHDSVTVGIIVVASKTNCGTDEKLEKLLDWIDWLNKNDVSGHFNPALPYEDVQEDLSLSPERLKEVWLRTWEWLKEESYRTWDPMRGYQSNLLGHTLNGCVNAKCDPFNADSAKIIKGDGGTSGCGKTWGTVADGVPFLQGPSSGNQYEDGQERYDMLMQVPGPYTEEVQNGEIEDQGGCKGCRYWSVCTGGCPSGAIDYDYRNRVIWCPAIYAMYEKIEEDMRSLFPDIRLVTDAVDSSDAETVDISPLVRNMNVSLAPFAAYRIEDNEKPRLTDGNKFRGHIERDVLEHILKHGSFQSMDQAKDVYSQLYDEEIISVDEQSQAIHADSVGTKTSSRDSASGEDLRDRGKSWEIVSDDDSPGSDEAGPGSGKTMGWSSPDETVTDPASAEESEAANQSGETGDDSVDTGWESGEEVTTEASDSDDDDDGRTDLDRKREGLGADPV